MHHRAGQTNSMPLMFLIVAVLLSIVFAFLTFTTRSQYLALSGKDTGPDAVLPGQYSQHLITIHTEVDDLRKKIDVQDEAIARLHQDILLADLALIRQNNIQVKP